MKKYSIIGRPFAGSLVVEFLLHKLKIPYDILFIDKDECKTKDFLKKNPLGRIPILITPDKNVIYESLAIINHITDRFEGLCPLKATPERDCYNQFLSLIATTIYPAYHRQYHTYQYGSEKSYNDIRNNARELNNMIYDYIDEKLNPYICGNNLTAVDYYLYMILLFESDKDELILNRISIKKFIDKLKLDETITFVMSNQPKIKKPKDNKSWKLINKKFTKITYQYNSRR